MEIQMKVRHGEGGGGVGTCSLYRSHNQMDVSPTHPQKFFFNELPVLCLTFGMTSTYSFIPSYPMKTTLPRFHPLKAILPPPPHRRLHSPVILRFWGTFYQQLSFSEHLTCVSRSNRVVESSLSGSKVIPKISWKF